MESPPELRMRDGEVSSPEERTKQGDLAARSREVPCLVAHKREETSRSMRRSRIMRDKTAAFLDLGFPPNKKAAF